MAIPFPEIDPIAFQIGPVAIRWYALAYLTGFIGGWRYVLRINQWGNARSTLTKDEIDDFLTWAILAVILGGRIGYILFYQLAYYLSDPSEILKLWHGGMSFHGGAAGVIIAMLIFSARRKISPFILADMVCAAVPIGLFFGRIANFINGELFGRVTDAPWGVVFPFAGDAPRHPSQLYEAGLEGLVLGIILFLLIRCRDVREKPGLVSGVFLAGYGIARLFVEFFREPDVQIGYIFGFATMGQILCIPMILAGLGLCIWAVRRDRP